MPLGPGPSKLADAYSPRYRTPLVVAACAENGTAAAIAPAAPMAATAITDLLRLSMSNPFGQPGRRGNRPLCPVSGVSSTLGGHRAAGIAPLSRICDNGRGIGAPRQRASLLAHAISRQR